jgi:hypothetical protein
MSRWLFKLYVWEFGMHHDMLKKHTIKTIPLESRKESEFGAHVDDDDEDAEDVTTAKKIPLAARPLRMKPYSKPFPASWTGPSNNLLRSLRKR